MEALQMLKFALKKSRLNFTKDWITSSFEMKEAESQQGVDMLARLLEVAEDDSDPGPHLSKEDRIDKILQEIAGGDHDDDPDEAVFGAWHFAPPF